MKSKRALKEFEHYLRRAGHSTPPRIPRAGIESMVSFYKEVRADDVDLEADGDMLLLQWGTYDWGSGAMFEVDIARQLIRGSGDDEHIWQLHLTYRFEPSEELHVIGRGDRWCGRPADVTSFTAFMMAHPALGAVGARGDGQVQLDYECAG